MKEDPNELPKDNASNDIDLNSELEVRIVALVLGEASASEREELERLIDQRPELQAFRQEIENVHDVLEDVGEGEWQPDSVNSDWELPNARRVEVLTRITDSDPSVIKLAAKSNPSVLPKRSWVRNQNTLRGLAKIAAVLCLAVFFGQTLLTMPMQLARESAGSRSADRLSGIAVSSKRVASAESSDELSSPPEYMYFDRAEFAVPVPLDDSLEATTAETMGMSEGFGFELESDLAMPGIADSESLKRGRVLLNDSANGRWEYEAEMDMGMDAYGGAGGGMGGVGMADGIASNGSVQGGEIVGDFAVSPITGQQMSASLGVDSKSIPNRLPDISFRSDASIADQPKGSSQLGFDFRELSEQQALKRSGRVLWGGAVNGDGSKDGSGVRLDPYFDNNQSGSDRASQLGEAPLEEQEPLQSGGTRIAGQRSLGRRFGEVLDEESDSAATSTPSTIPESGLVAGKRLPANSAKSPELRESLLELESSSVALGVQVLDGEQIESAPSQFFGKVPAVKSEALGRERFDSKAKLRRTRAAIRGLETINLADAGANWEKLQGNKKMSAGSELKLLPDRGYSAHIKLPASRQAASLEEKSAAQEAFSTFSLHVGDVSFKLAQAALAGGSWPEPATVRIEEFINALEYGDPLPSQSERVACRVEQAIHPFLQQRNLLRVSMRTAATGRASTTPLRLTLLLDNSGSMERMDRQQTVRRALTLLAGQLEAMDQVTLISFARQPRLLADRVNGTKSAELVQMIENLPSEGGTNLEAALELAFEKAREQQNTGAQNRIILLTDGAVNLGDANPESLSQLIETMRSQGIAFDAAGIGADGLNDEILEALTRKGDGRYYLLDSAEAADDGFARQIAGALRPAAMNVKVQVEFNPERVGQYKLLGFEKHMLAKEDFRNDKVDAAEMAAAEAGVAVYQFEANPNGQGDVGSVSVRFRDVSTGQMIEDRWPIPYQSNALRLDESAPSMRMAAAAALFAAKLRGDGLGQSVDLKSLTRFLANLPDQGDSSKRVSLLQQMIQQARQLQGE